MKLGELKKSLHKLPPDMDDMEVVVLYALNDQRQFDLLCFTGYIPMKGREMIGLGTLSEVQRMVEHGEMEKPEGYIEPDVNDQSKDTL